MHAEKFCPGGAVRDGPDTGRILWKKNLRGSAFEETGFFANRPAGLFLVHIWTIL
jgi:hypothetical protein